MSTMNRHTFTQAERLKTYREFRVVMKDGQCWKDTVLRVHFMQNFLDVSRLGVMTSRKVGGAVERARWRRLVRESFRLHKHELKWTVDVLVVPLVPPGERKTADITERLRRSISSYIRTYPRRSKPNA